MRRCSIESRSALLGAAGAGVAARPSVPVLRLRHTRAPEMLSVEVIVEALAWLEREALAQPLFAGTRRSWHAPRMIRRDASHRTGRAQAIFVSHR
jgi:hypothetical protein